MAARSTRSASSPWHHVDLALVAVLVLLSVMSVVMVLAATHGPRTTTNDTFFMQRQAVFVLIGFAAMAAVAAFDYRALHNWWHTLYGAGLVSLVFVLLFGIEAKGAQRGFELGGFQLQPSELMKAAVVVALAGYLTADEADDTSWRRTFMALAVVGVPVFAILLQPDLGTALVFGAITLGVLLVAEVPVRQMLGLIVVVVVAAAMLISSPVLADYQKARLTVFIDPGAVDVESRYNTEQSQIAIANGGLTGQGLLKGGQTANGFVPEQQTDFIFTAIGEELGFVGAAFSLALYGVLLWRILRAAQLSRDRFGTLICAGVFSFLLFQIFENVGMAMGIMPVTGIPLPFMSYGGSSVILSFVMAGLVLNVRMHRFS